MPIIESYAWPFRFSHVEAQAAKEIDEFAAGLLPGLATQEYNDWDKAKSGSIPTDRLDAMLTEFGITSNPKTLSVIKTEMKLGATMALKEFVHIVKKQHEANPIVKPKKEEKKSAEGE